ncbi:unnamed protein product [Paramecium octaurelia]|uniref:Uncharacterized protein n=1 Tax=Paramecium octaurelia TaxID=43137 RepID=A0A8S1X882_PAROT|nr:unnamed protein product [Paramecium octaurelia]
MSIEAQKTYMTKQSQYNTGSYFSICSKCHQKSYWCAYIFQGRQFLEEILFYQWENWREYRLLDYQVIMGLQCIYFG